MELFRYILYRLLFNALDPIFYSFVSKKFFSVSSLSGSQTFHFLSEVNPEKLILSRNRLAFVHFTVVRDDKLRIVSAFNKKVLACDSFSKRVLLFCHNMTPQMDFNEFLGVLEYRKRNGLFIDRHFRPALGRNFIDLNDDVAQLSNALDIDLSRVKKKGSQSMLKDEEILHLDAIDSETYKRLQEYLLE